MWLKLGTEEVYIEAINILLLASLHLIILIVPTLCVETDFVTLLRYETPERLWMNYHAERGSLNCSFVDWEN